MKIRNGGFTLIEVLIVVLIVAILAAIAVPQYQKAVLKSRFSSLMPTTQAIRDGQEMYYMTNGRYTDVVNKLDVTTANTEDMTITLSDDDDYAYTMATRSNINNNLIMYQKHSVNFPGEIHCEALEGNSQAEWLCSTALHSVKELGEVITKGYNTYVLEGIGMGLTPAQVEAAKNCAAAYASGATTCNITDNASTHGKTKQVCYSIKGTDDYCITTELNENNQQTKRTVCRGGVCEVSEYNDAGDRISRNECYGSSLSSDGKSCDNYDYIYEYGYDSVTGKKTSQKSCSGSNLSSDGKSCDKYNSIYEYGYDDAGNVTSTKFCSGDAINNETKRCDTYQRITEAGYDEDGNKTYDKSCKTLNAAKTACEEWYDPGYTDF